MCFGGNNSSSNVKPAGYSTEDAYKQVKVTTEPVNKDGGPVQTPLGPRADDTLMRPRDTTPVGTGGLNNSNLM